MSNDWENYIDHPWPAISPNEERRRVLAEYDRLWAELDLSQVSSAGGRYRAYDRELNEMDKQKVNWKEEGF